MLRSNDVSSYIMRTTNLIRPLPISVVPGQFEFGVKAVLDLRARAGFRFLSALAADLTALKTHVIVHKMELYLTV